MLSESLHHNADLVVFDLAGCVELGLENWLGSGESDAFSNRDNLEDIFCDEAGNLFVYAFNS